MTTRTVTAMFSNRADAERAAQMLVSELGIDRTAVRTSPEAGLTDTGYDASKPYAETGFWASLKDMFLPEEDRYAYSEGMRRGNVLVSASVQEGHVSRAADILEQAGALDLDAQEATWRQSGWKGYDASMATSGTMAGAATTGMATTGTATTGAVAGQALGTDDTIKVVEERLVVGKRERELGRVRVRSYVVERPVEEQVSLHEERVTLERHPVDRALTDADRAAAFQERTIEATARAEEAVVGKDVRVVEEIGVRKEAADRVETVRDTVRRTEVEVDDQTAKVAGTTTGVTGTTGVGTAGAGTTGTTTTGSKLAGAAERGAASVDRTLGTNVSGTNPKT